MNHQIELKVLHPLSNHVTRFIKLLTQKLQFPSNSSKKQIRRLLRLLLIPNKSNNHKSPIKPSLNCLLSGGAILNDIEFRGNTIPN